MGSVISFAQRQAQRGYHLPYRPHMACPGCGHSNWWIGSESAECAYCGTALALPKAIRRGGIIFKTKPRIA